MPAIRRPAGPGQPRRERRDVVTQQEQIDDLAAERRSPQPTDAQGDAGPAERAAHTARDRDAHRRRR